MIDYNEKTSQGETALDLAQGHDRICDFLKARGAKFSVSRSDDLNEQILRF